MIRPPQSLLSLGPSDSAKTLEEGRVCVVRVDFDQKRVAKRSVF